MFKFNESTQADGPTYFIHNSFVWNTDIGKKYGIDHFTFVNNAIARTSYAGNLFGSKWYAPATVPNFEKDAFTRRWAARNINFESNVIDAQPKQGFAGDFHFPDQLRMFGYPIPLNNWGESPQFNLNGELAQTSLRPGSNSICIGRATKLSLKLPAEGKVEVAERDIGAWQQTGLFALTSELPFIDEPVAESVNSTSLHNI